MCINELLQKVTTMNDNKIKAYRVYATGGTYYSLDKVDDAIQETVWLLYPEWIKYNATAEPTFAIGRDILIPAKSHLKTITRKSCAIPYLQTPYGFKNIYLKVKRLEK